MKLKEVLGIGVLVVSLSSVASAEEYIKELEVDVGSVIEVGEILNVDDTSASNDVTDNTIVLYEEGDCTLTLESGQKVHVSAADSKEELKETDLLIEDTGIIEDNSTDVEEEIIDNSPEITVENVEDVSYLFENYDTSSVSVNGDLLEDDFVVVEKSEAKLNKKRYFGIKGTGFYLTVENGEAISYHQSDKDVIDVYSDGEVRLNNEGHSKVFVETEGELLFCDVYVIDPVVNTEDAVIVEGETHQIEIEGTLYGCRPKYSILSGEGSTVTSDGKVSVPLNESCKVEIDICGQKFIKKVSCMSYKEKLWKDMQPAIESCLGTPYVMGGFTPGVGLDCSGYVSYVLGTVGKMWGRTSAQGLYNMFPSTDNPEPGDLVFFQGTYDCPDYITHVGIYAGDGMMYHSGSPNQKVGIYGYFSQHLVGYGKVD